MSRYDGSQMKVFASEKEVNSFLQSGEVGLIVGLFMKKNESFVLFYLKDEPIVSKEIKKHAQKEQRKE
jgi:hypothetical protein